MPHLPAVVCGAIKRCGLVPEHVLAYTRCEHQRALTLQQGDQDIHYVSNKVRGARDIAAAAAVAQEQEQQQQHLQQQQS
ncbi:hypothetical protein OEZ86_010988 [Tetradesmus obliquus]|nr:hypothetical protein OEZ86_010988 [Tetradesmus obliquus]